VSLGVSVESAKVVRWSAAPKRNTGMENAAIEIYKNYAVYKSENI
jgi:hypothetical protein